MAFNDIQNRLSTPFIPDSNIVFTLAPGLKMLQGRVILSGQVVLSAGSANGTISGEGGPINLIERIYVTANSASGSRYTGGRMVDCSPRALLRYAITEHQGKFLGDLLAATLGNGANGTYTIYTSIPMYFADSTLQNQMLTAFNMDLADSQGNPIYSSVQVQIDTGDVTTCFTGNNATVNWSGLTVQWVDDRLGLAADTVPLRQENHYALIAATQTRMIDPAMPVDGAFNTWLILAEQSAAYTLSQALLNKVEAYGAGINLKLYNYDIQQAMIEEEFYDPSQSLTGQYYIDFTKGLLQNSNAAPGLSVTFDVNNVSGANLDRLNIYTRRVYQLIS